MSKDLMIVEDGKVYVGTWELSKFFGMEHRRFTILIRKYSKEFGEVKFSWFNPKSPDAKKSNGSSDGPDAKKSNGLKGGLIKNYLLDEQQAALVSSFLRNTEKVRQFKVFISKEFINQREAIKRACAAAVNPKYPGRSAGWIELRERGKIERRFQTDIIEKFIDYAYAQGATHADMYYASITVMENNSLFYMEMLIGKVPNVRNIVDELGLTALQVADRIIGNALIEGMSREMHYKDIFQLAKERVLVFVSHHGKIPIGRMGCDVKKTLEEVRPAAKQSKK